MQKKSIPFNEARELLAEGDVLLFRGKGFLSTIIQRASEGTYSHVGLASGVGDNGGKIWECIEFREGGGGRSSNLRRYVEKEPGIIDVYRAVPTKYGLYYDQYKNQVIERTIKFNGKKVTNIMRRMTGLPYGYRRLFWIAQHKLPFLRWFYSIESTVDDDTSDPIYPVCSSAVSYCFSRINYDLVHNRADSYTEPSDLSRSPLLHYIFTLV